MTEIVATRDLGEAVRRERKAQGLTQTMLADLSGVSLSFISGFENGKETVELGRALRVVQTLGMDVLCRKRG